MAPRLKPELIDAVRRLGDTMTAREVAAELGLSDIVVRGIVRHHGVKLKMERHFAKPRLIEAIRRRAETGKSTAEVAAELGMTRNAVIGLAHRKGIQFRGKRIRGPSRAPRSVREPKFEAAPPKPIHRKPPSGRCSWAGCSCPTEQMFCYGHRKSPVIAPVANHP